MAADSYTLLDHGNGQKLEQFGPHTLIRPCGQALWNKTSSEDLWKKADASFSRQGKLHWEKKKKLPSTWTITVNNLQFKIQPTDFGHLGIFPEHIPFWKWMQDIITKEKRDFSLLNLFAYSGGASLSAAKVGASVVHVDSSKGMNCWAKENAALNNLENAPIRYITDDAVKFLIKEKKRGRSYDGIILDPPSFGRGAKGEVFKIETAIIPLLSLCRELLSEQAQFLFFSCHTPGFTPQVMQNLLSPLFSEKSGSIDCGEMLIPHANPLPSGVFARWQKNI